MRKPLRVGGLDLVGQAQELLVLLLREGVRASAPEIARARLVEEVRESSS